MATSSLDLLDLAREGDVAALGRLMSRIESADDEVRETRARLYRSGGKAHIVGITGVPGSGKSSLVSRLAQAARAEGAKIGVLAIDPSSAFSGGALLGDRTRMSELAPDVGVFIRSMATRGATGGLASAALGAVDALDACGYELVFVETVGVGQDEIEIASACHTTVVVSAPGLGDQVQALKAGLLEIADIHVVSKCDRPDGAQTLSDLAGLMALRGAEAPWRAPVIATSAHTGQGVAQLLGALRQHRSVLAGSELGASRQRRIAEYRAWKSVEELLHRRLAPARNEAFAMLVERMARREIDPLAAAESLLASSALKGA